MSNATHDKLDAIGDWLGDGSINFFGQPFAGKDNQAKQFGRHFGTPVLGGGNILRAMILEAEIEAAMHAGELIDSKYFLRNVVTTLGGLAVAGKPLVLSSVGRVQGEELPVMDALQALDHPAKLVVNLEIDNEEVFMRSERQRKVVRPDDNPSSLSTRLQEYEDKTVPVLRTYEDLGLLINIDAHGPKEAVLERIIDTIVETRLA